MPTFRHEGHRLAYTIHGDGPRTFVLVHGLLLSQKMHGPLARTLAERGHRVVTLDLLGHGKSARPRDMTLYSMSFFGEQMIALLDHLELDEAVLGGTSLGANATLEAAAHAPERVRGMVLEMPVLDNALLAAAGRVIGSPNVSATIHGVNAIAQASSALSSTGISTTIPRSRSGACAATSSVTLAPRVVPPTTASSSSRWSSSPTTCSLKSGIE